MRLLLNADDLGYTPAINQAIFDLHNHGRLFSTSLLVNMSYSQNAIDDLSSYPALKVGVHLNLTKGYPMLPSKKIPSLVTPSGKFWATKQFYARAVSGQINLREVDAELRMQIERLLEAKVQPTHLDSHSHWHMLPHLRRIVIRLAEEYQIPAVRQAAFRRTLVPMCFWFAVVDQRCPSHSKIHFPDYLLSLHQWMGPGGQPVELFFRQRLRRLIAPPEITLELVTHPGILQDPDFPPDTLLTHQRQWEYDFLLSSHFDEWLAMMEAEIVDYGKIVQSTNERKFERTIRDA
jgi:predicted glycoside hydrolase/deacetylase ChbG (UPF0249 family)